MAIVTESDVTWEGVARSRMLRVGNGKKERRTDGDGRKAQRVEVGRAESVLKTTPPETATRSNLEI